MIALAEYLGTSEAFLRMKFAGDAYKQYKCPQPYPEAEKEGISEKTLKRAQRELKQSAELVIQVDDRRQSGAGYWWVVMPREEKVIGHEDVI